MTVVRAAGATRWVMQNGCAQRQLDGDCSHKPERAHLQSAQLLCVDSRTQTRRLAWDWRHRAPDPLRLWPVLGPLHGTWQPREAPAFQIPRLCLQESWVCENQQMWRLGQVLTAVLLGIQTQRGARMIAIDRAASALFIDVHSLPHLVLGMADLRNAARVCAARSTAVQLGHGRINTRSRAQRP